MKNLKLLIILIFFVAIISSCKKVNFVEKESNHKTLKIEILDTIVANVLAVVFTGNEHAYTANVTIESPDIDCDQYANWWEIISLDGNLIYRRILQHSHANEQPFTRSGSPISVTANQLIYIRAYMHSNGYGGKVLKGSVECGFVQQDLDATFYDNLATEEPLPTVCLY